MQNLFGSMKLSSEEMKQAQHFWTMLDDMASNDPEAYKKFIQSNIKEGAEQAKKEREKEIKLLGTKPQVGYLLRMNGQLSTVSLNEEDSKEFSKFLITQEETTSRNPESIRIYLNICHSSQVLKPLTKTGEICKNIQDQQNWHDIPVSFPDFSTSRKQYEDVANYYFIAIINDELFSFIQEKKGPILQSVQNYLLEKFQFRLKTDRNPVKNFSKLEYKYYKIEPSTIILRKKKFKFKGIAEPKEYLLDPNTDIELFKKKQKILEQKKEIQVTKEDTATPNIIIGNTNQQNISSSKKPLIQEIGETIHENEDQLQYKIKEEPDKYILEVSFEDAEIAKSFDLNVSENIIKLEIEFKKPLVINLDKKISNENVKATLKKKKKLLIIEAAKL